MSTIHRATLAALVIAAFAPAAFAQGKDLTKTDPKLFASLQCPQAVSGAVTESIHAKVVAPWDLVPAKQKREFPVESMTIEQIGPKEGSRVTCRYAGVDSTLQAVLPKNCEAKLVGPWSGPSSQIGATRVPASGSRKVRQRSEHRARSVKSKRFSA